MKTIRWHTKDGSSIPIEDLSTEHLLSIKKMLENQAARNVESYRKCMQYVTGEKAVRALDRLIEEAGEDGVEWHFPIYHFIVKELRERE